jgi:hypothetical protein
VEDEHTSSVTVLLGQGDGTFAPSPSISLSQGPLVIGSGDFNGDGKSDLAVANGTTVPVYLAQVTVTGTVAATGISIVGTGTHQVEASYSGDGNYSPNVSSTIGLSAQPLATTLLLTGIPDSSTFGQHITLSAQLTPYTAQGYATDGESIEFLNGSTSLGTGVLAGGLATLNVSSLLGGTSNLSASYLGDANFAAAKSSVLPYVVSPAATTVTWTPPATAVHSGQPIAANLLTATSATPGVFTYTY